MCGILGAFDTSKRLNKDTFDAALDLIKHRGPDYGATESFDNNALMLGHRRLKILDLSDRANQPMHSSCGRYVIIYNGETYNYRELRTQLSDYPFQTDCDTEVLLALYTKHGAQMLPMLNGMFAFAIYDKQAHSLFLARDRFGIKPLYYHCDQSRLIFASEIPPILKLTGNAEPDLDTIATYLKTAAYDFGEYTFFKNILRLEPGCCATITPDNLTPRIERWYNTTDHIQQTDRAPDEDELHDILKRVCKRHLISDVPVGVNISGGVDSSTLLHYINYYHPRIHGFTQDYTPPYSERPWVEKAARHTGAQSHFILIEAERSLQQFEAVIKNQAEPFGGIPVIGYHFLYKETNAHNITVLLDGNGVDEALLGYKKYHYALLTDLAGRPDYDSALSQFMQFWGDDKQQIENIITGMNQSSGTALDGTLAVADDTLSDALNQREIRRPPLPESTGSKARDMALADLLATKIPRALRFNDRVSMMHSKELRVPFLDPELVEWSLKVPTSFLINQHGTKAPLRRLIGKHIDPSVAAAPKRNVQSPQREWLANEWRPYIENMLESSSFKDRGWINPIQAKARYDRYLNGDNANSFFLWQWLNLEVWAREFLD